MSTANTRLAPLASNTSVNPPVDAPMSRQTWSSISIGYCSSAPMSLTPPRDTKGCAGCADRVASAAMTSDAFATCLPSAVTPPASIAARARARLSNSPRSTSSTSARLRGEVPFSLLSVTVSSLAGGAFRHKAHTRLKRGEIMPDIRRCPSRHHERVTMQIERVDHHQIIRQAEILHRESVAIDQLTASGFRQFVISRDAFGIGRRIIAVGEQQLAAAGHIAEFVDRTGVGAGAAKRRQVCNDRIRRIHHRFIALEDIERG